MSGTAMTSRHFGTDYIPSINAEQEARRLVAGLKGKWQGRSGICRCPAHDDRNPSLSVGHADGRVLVKCHGPCSQAQVIARLRILGLWVTAGGERNAIKSVGHPSRGAEAPATSLKVATRIWRESSDVVGSPAERYLRSRAVFSPPAGSDALRFHESLPHPSGSRWPCMVALITRAADGEFIGIHRTYLQADGSAKAPVQPVRMILGAKRSGVIRLVADDEIATRLAVAEGIETALTALSAGWPCWSAIDAGNMASLPAWPGTDLTVFADHDMAGIDAAEELASRWIAVGGAANIIAAQYQGEDWNDVAMSGRFE